MKAKNNPPRNFDELEQLYKNNQPQDEVSDFQTVWKTISPQVTNKTRANTLLPRFGYAFALACICAIVAGTLFLITPSDFEKQTAALAIPVKGQTFVQKPGSSQWIKLNNNSQLLAGSRIKTTGTAECLIHFYDKGVIQLFADTAIRLDKIKTSNAFTLYVTLEQGGVTAQLRHLASQEHFEIKTSEWTVSAVGTRFFCGFKPDGSYQAAVYEGIIELKPTGQVNKSPLRLKEGEEITLDKKVFTRADQGELPVKLVQPLKSAELVRKNTLTENSIQTHPQKFQNLPASDYIQPQEGKSEYTFHKLDAFPAFDLAQEIVSSKGKIVCLALDKVILYQPLNSKVTVIPIEVSADKLAAPAIDDNRIITITKTGELMVRNLSGKAIWTASRLGSLVFDSAPAASDGIIILQTVENGLSIYQWNGNQYLNIPLGLNTRDLSFYSGPLILDGGKQAVFADEDGTIYGFDTVEKKIKYSTNLNLGRIIEPLWGNTAIAGTFYQKQNFIMAFQPSNGKMLWKFSDNGLSTAERKAYLSPDALFIQATGNDGDWIYALNPQNGLLKKKIKVQDRVVACALFQDKLVYLTKSRELHRFDGAQDQRIGTISLNYSLKSIAAVDQELLFFTDKGLILMRVIR